jgi:hypothetical protein
VGGTKADAPTASACRAQKRTEEMRQPQQPSFDSGSSRRRRVVMRGAHAVGAFTGSTG